MKHIVIFKYKALRPRSEMRLSLTELSFRSPILPVECCESTVKGSQREYLKLSPKVGKPSRFTVSGRGKARRITYLKLSPKDNTQRRYYAIVLKESLIIRVRSTRRPRKTSTPAVAWPLTP
jgi:hypothetical protein